MAAFLFTGDDVFKRISDLSGGERGRVSLAKLMLSEANFLILDEPTNHLDITSKEILEDALINYTGTVLYVSHDRYFINKTATRILDLTGQRLINYIGDYDYYLEKKEVMETLYTSQAPAPSISSEPVSQAEGKLDWKAQKEEQAKKRKRQNDLRKTEEEIASLESKNSDLDTLLTTEEVYTDHEKVREINAEKQQIGERLETLYALWEELAEEE